MKTSNSPTASNLTGLCLDKLIITLALAIVCVGCGSTSPPSNKVAGEDALAGWRTWQAKRVQSVAGTNGWTTLVGLHWLREGTNTAGSAPENDIMLPKERAGARVGSFVRNGRQVRFVAAPGVELTVKGEKVREVAMDSDEHEVPTKLRLGQLAVVVIERGERMGLRVRDPESAARREFRGLKYFPYDPAWRIEGRFVPYPQKDELRVTDVTGGSQVMPSPGEVVFQVKGSEHRLAVAEERGEKDYFVMFRDATAGTGTYPTGRFLYVEPPDAEGRVTIDFNRAYNPPCAFTPHATCPLPPAQNRLDFPIRAGERNAHER